MGNAAEENGADGQAGARRRVRRSLAEKRQIVEATLMAGASVARVAREHGVNANQVFYWRQLFRQGRLGAPAETTGLLAVRVAPERATAAGGGGLELEYRGGRLRVESGADPSLLRMVLEHWIG